MKNIILILTLIGAASFTRALGATVPVADTHGNSHDLILGHVIHQDLLKQSNLSVAAKSVKIIVLDGDVILRGPVRSELEANQVLATARRAAGETRVQDQLDIKTSN